MKLPAIVISQWLPIEKTVLLYNRLPITPVPLAVLLVEQNHDEVVVEQVLVVERHRGDGFRLETLERRIRADSTDWI